MNRFLHIVVAVFLFGFSAAQDNSFTLNQAVDYALEHSYSMILADDDVTISVQQKRETTAMGLPQINGSVAYQNFIDLPVNLVPAEFFGGQPGEFAELVFGTEQTASAGIVANQLIFDGSYIIALQTSAFYLETVRDMKEKTAIEVEDAVTRAYYLALAAKENERILLESKLTTEQMLFEMEQMYENGFVESTDVDQVRLMFSNVNNSYENAQRYLVLSENLLKFQMGMTLTEQISLSDSLSVFINEIYAEPVVQEFQPDLHIDYVLATNNEHAKVLLLKLEKMKYLPSVGAFFSHTQNAYANGFEFFDTKWYPTNVWGLNVSVPIFSGFMRSARVQKAEIELHKAQTMVEQVSEGLALQSIQAQSDYTFAKDNFETQQENLDLSQNIKNITYIKYQEGEATSLDVAQAENQHLQTQSTYIQAVVQLLQAKADLNKSFNNYTSNEEN